jgi:chloramphenicol 3-O-phosphotransferase
VHEAALVALTAFTNAGFNVFGEAYIWNRGMLELAASVFGSRWAFVGSAYGPGRARS